MPTKSPLRALALFLCAAALATPAWAVQRPAAGSVLPDRDARWSAGHRLAASALQLQGLTSGALLAGPRAEPGELRRAELLAWEAELGDQLSVRWDSLTGSPVLVHARRGWLSGPDPRPAAAIARELVLARGALFSLDAKQVLGLRLESEVPLGDGGTLVHFAQDLGGRRVEHGHLSVAVGADGRVLALFGGGVSGARAATGFTPRLDVSAALKSLLGMAEIEVAELPQPVELLAHGAVFDLSGSGLGRLEVRQVVVQTVHGPRLAWKTRVDTADSLASYELLLDDATGLALRRQNLMLYMDTRGRAFRIHPDASSHDQIRFVDPDVYRSNESPAGWTELDQSFGNNTLVRDDREGDNEDTLGAIATAFPPPPSIDFDFPFTGDTTVDLDQSITQLFYGINMSHDRFHRLGVTEAAGAYQNDNFGLPGLGDDAVLGDTQEGPNPNNNANFNPRPDGEPGRMQMYIWRIDGVLKDSSNDVGVVIHEYAHGVTTRLVGGPTNVGCLGTRQGGAMGEGWGDYFAASWLGDTRIGSYLTDDGEGIRIFRLDDNPPGVEPDEDVDGDGIPDPQKDYGDFCEQRFDDQANGTCEVHDNGEIWSGFLWLVREAFVNAYGEDGGDLADQLVVEGLKLTACSPSMLDARDGILLADRLLHGGAHFCLISSIAAERGMGFTARSVDGNDADPAEAFDQWPECIDAGRVSFTREGLEDGAVETLYSCEDEIIISVTDGNAGSPTVDVTIAALSGDSETVTLTAGVDPASYRGSIFTLAGGSAPGDGILQVAAGDAVNVTYADPDLGGPASASAAIDCTARIRVLSYRITNSTCDDDTVAGFPELPGFLDAGESADIVLELANDMPVALRGGVLVTTDRPDLFTVLPVASPLPLDLPAAAGVTPGRQSITLRAVAVDDFLGATSAVLQLSLLVSGFDPATTYDMTLELDFDYELLAGQQLTFDPETETALPVGPDWTTGELDAGVGNEWSVVDCWAATGTRSYRNGPTDCSGNYSDDQGRPWLAPPAIDLAQPGTVGARLLNLSFQHDVDLAVDGTRFRFFDAEGVAVYLTDDPGAIDPGDGFAFGEGALAAYTPLDIFGQTSDNTTGWEPQSIDIPADAVTVDLLQPFQLVWLFVADFTPSQDQGGTVYDVQAGGYYLDDVVLTYDLVNKVPSAAACTSAAAVLSLPVIAEPPGATGCANAPVLIDASLSEGLACGGGDLLDYRFLNAAGLAVACFDDNAMAMARLQDVDGWGTTTECWDFPAADTTYQVEVRCQADPATTDLREVSVSILHGTAILDPSPNSICRGVDLNLSALESAIAGCPGPLEYLFADAVTGPLDCDLDGLPEDFSTSETCSLLDPRAELDLTLTVRCQALPACEFTQRLVVPELLIVPVAEERDPANSPYCPGAAAPVTAASSTITGCDGTVLYSWTSPSGVDTGWRQSPRVNLVFADDDVVTLTVQCTSVPECTASTTIPIDVREGAFEITVTQDPLACPGEPLQLGINAIEPLQCSGAPEYLFIRDGVPFDCDGDGMPEDWSSFDTCDTVSIDGGANYRVDVRCDTALTCRMSSGIERIEAANTGLPSGDPQGTLRVTKNGNCPPAEALLDWSDSGRVRPAFSVLRSDDPAFPGLPIDHLLADVDATAWADDTALCRAGTRVSVRYYTVLDRNTCTGEPIAP